MYYYYYMINEWVDEQIFFLLLLFNSRTRRDEVGFIFRRIHLRVKVMYDAMEYKWINNIIFFFFFLLNILHRVLLYASDMFYKPYNFQYIQNVPKLNSIAVVFNLFYSRPTFFFLIFFLLYIFRVRSLLTMKITTTKKAKIA